MYIRYDLHGVTVEISTSSTDLLKALHGRLGHLPPAYGPADLTFLYTSGSGDVAPPSAAARPVYDTALGDVLYEDGADSLVVTVPGRARMRCDVAAGHVCVDADDVKSNLWLLSRPLFTLALVELLRARGWYSLHAAGVQQDGRAVLFPGPSGTGKTTLTLALLRGGFAPLGDDLQFLSEQSGRVLAFGLPEDLDVTRDTLDLFPEIVPQVRPEQFGPKRQVAINAWSQGGAVPTALIFPEVGFRETSVLTPISTGEALLELAPNVLLTGGAAVTGHLRSLGALVSQCSCYRLRTGRDLHALPSLISGLSGSLAAAA